MALIPQKVAPPLRIAVGWRATRKPKLIDPVPRSASRIFRPNALFSRKAPLTCFPTCPHSRHAETDGLLPSIIPIIEGNSDQIDPLPDIECVDEP